MSLYLIKVILVYYNGTRAFKPYKNIQHNTSLAVLVVIDCPIDLHGLDSTNFDVLLEKKEGARVKTRMFITFIYLTYKDDFITCCV